jgi:2-succinyl-5-enolpyruvyl-6-hydroxy-3-cyclohexene-1-carboxylate synthase
MIGSPANTLWARCLLDELARAGVEEVVVAPGSRSTPLVLAAARDDRLRVRVHLDERSAAFFALGVGKATGRPAAVITTSGTAVANVMPAVVEASQSGVPLVVLTADRPHRLRDADANQAIDQVGIFGSFVRRAWDLGLPSLSGPATRHVRVVAARAYAASVAPDPGPVHVNVPFGKPLEPAEVPDAFAAEHPLACFGRADGAPFVDVDRARPRASDDRLDELARLLAGKGDGKPARGVVVAGPSEEAARVGPAARRLAAALGWPLLADPLSGARYGPDDGAHVLGTYDLFLASARVRDVLEPDVILRVGASPTSAALQEWMLHHQGATHVVVDAAARWKDHGATATHYEVADPTDVLERLATHPAAPGVDPAWSGAWREADEAARSAVGEIAARARPAPGGSPGGGGEDPPPGPHEGLVVADLLDTLPEGSNLFVSSSMPIRDVDAYGVPSPRTVHVFANRGASGIDGVVSSAFGVASQRDAPTVCVIGDVAFFHDRNGLLWSREPDAPVVFVLIDNDGGGIFHMLPISEHEPSFTTCFATPHGVDPRPVAASHGIREVDVEPDDLAAALSDAIEVGTTSVLVVRTDRAANHRWHVDTRRAVTRSVEAALE